MERVEPPGAPRRKRTDVCVEVKSSSIGAGVLWAAELARRISGVALGDPFLEAE